VAYFTLTRVDIPNLLSTLLSSLHLLPSSFFPSPLTPTLVALREWNVAYFTLTRVDIPNLLQKLFLRLSHVTLPEPQPTPAVPHGEHALVETPEFKWMFSTFGIQFAGLGVGQKWDLFVKPLFTVRSFFFYSSKIFLKSFYKTPNEFI
jgi:hypothetical protein